DRVDECSVEIEEDGAARGVRHGARKLTTRPIFGVFPVSIKRATLDPHAEAAEGGSEGGVAVGGVASAAGRAADAARHDGRGFRARRGAARFGAEFRRTVAHRGWRL